MSLNSLKHHPRLRLVLDYLLEQHLIDGRPVLPPFLTALRDRYQVGNALRDELEALRKDVQLAISPSGSFLPSEHSHQTVQVQSPRTITWLHVSDLHFRASQRYDSSVVLRALLRDVPECVREYELYLDFIVVTGDIAFSGKL